MRRSLCFGRGGAVCPWIVLVSEALPLLRGRGGGGILSMYCLVSEMLPLLGGGQNVHGLY